MRKLTTIAVLLGMLAAAAGAAAGEGAGNPEAPVVRPGMAWQGADSTDPSGFCTLAFPFRDGDDIYATTAGHCFVVAPNVGGGEVIFAEDERPAVRLLFRDGGELGPRIGVGVYVGVRWPEDAVLDTVPDLPLFMDFGVILLDQIVAYDPAMCFFGGPTGLNEDVTPVPTLAHVYGAGLGYDQDTRTTLLPGRSGPLSLAAPEVALHAMPAYSGDSGSPILDHGGRAVAIFSSPESSGRLEPGLRRVHEVLGLDLQPLTAPLTGSPPAGADPACAPWSAE